MTSLGADRVRTAAARFGPFEGRTPVDAAGVDAAFREGNLRLSLHLVNTADDVHRTLAALPVPNGRP